MSEPAPLLTTLLVSFNTRDLLAPCLDALAVARAPLGESPVIVVDNASADGSAEYLEQQALYNSWNSCGNSEIAVQTRATPGV